MGLIPARELGDQGRDGRPRVADGRTRTEPSLDQVGLKALHGEGRVMADPATIGGGTVTPSEMTTKRSHRGGVKIRKGLTPARQEHPKVGSSAQVPDHGRGRVAVTREGFREGVDVGAAESVAQPPQRLGCREVPVDHRVLLSKWAGIGRPTVEQKSADGYGE